jgi:hypothetical protein
MKSAYQGLSGYLFAAVKAYPTCFGRRVSFGQSIIQDIEGHPLLLKLYQQRLTLVSVCDIE